MVFLSALFSLEEFRLPKNSMSEIFRRRPFLCLRYLVNDMFISKHLYLYGCFLSIVFLPSFWPCSFCCGDFLFKAPVSSFLCWYRPRFIEDFATTRTMSTKKSKTKRTIITPGSSIISKTKRSRKQTTVMDGNKAADSGNEDSRAAAAAATQPPPFRAVSSAREAKCLTDGVQLSTLRSPQSAKHGDRSDDANDDRVIIPWVGYGTYKLGKQHAESATFKAIQQGYRMIDTAFIYGGETTELAVGRAVQRALNQNIIESRNDIFITTKQWRKYHGYEATLQCLKQSLKRLQVDYIDLYLIHWPGPAYNSMTPTKGCIGNVRPVALCHLFGNRNCYTQGRNVAGYGRCLSTRHGSGDWC